MLILENNTKEKDMWGLFKWICRNKVTVLRNKHDKATDTVILTENEIIHVVFVEYLDEEARQELLDDAKAFCYSREKICNIESAFNDYNKDSITFNVALDVIDAKKHIKEHKRESFFSKIANIIPDDETE